MIRVIGRFQRNDRLSVRFFGIHAVMFSFTAFLYAQNERIVLFRKNVLKNRVIGNLKFKHYEYNLVFYVFDPTRESQKMPRVLPARISSDPTF